MSISGGIQKVTLGWEIIVSEVLKENEIMLLDKDLGWDKYGDGRMILKHKDKELLELYPVEIINEGMKTTISQKYIKL